MRLQAVLLLLSLDLAAAFQLSLRARFRAASSLCRTSSARSAFPVQAYFKPDGAVVPGASPLHMAAAGGPEAGGSGKGSTRTKIPDNVSASAAVGGDVDGAVAEEAKDGVGHTTAAAEGSKEGEGGGSKGDEVGGELKALEKGQGDVEKGAGDVGTAAPKAPSGVGINSVPAENGEISDESEFTELEKAFAEARRRSLAQGARPKAKTAKPAVAVKTSKPTLDPAAAAPVDKPPDADVASKPTTAAAAATSEAPPAKPSASATTESPAIKTPINSAAASAKPATEPPKAEAAPTPATAELPSSPKPAPAPETATPPKSQAVESREPVPVKSKESKPEASEKEPTRAFSLGAESLEEFFGLKKKPRMISTTAPLSSPPSTGGEDPSGMPKLDKVAVDSMLEENGLNEVTLKENFRKMEAEAKAKATQVSDESPKEASEIPVTPETSETMEPPATPFVNPFGFLATIFSPATATTTKKDSALADASEQPPAATSIEASEVTRRRVSSPTSPVVPDKEKEKKVKTAQVSDKSPKEASEIPVTPETSETMEPPATPFVNPFGFLATIFSPAPATTTKEDSALADASEQAPAAASGKASEVTRPRVSAPTSPVVPEKEKEKEKKKEPEEQAAAGWGGLGDIFSGMFAEPVYDDEVDTLPKERSSAPRAMPVFAPPPAPAPKATPLPEPSASKTKAKAKAAPAKSDAPTPLSFLDGLFGGGKETAPPSPAPAPARAPSPAPAPVPVPAAAEQKSSAASLFDGLFGGGGKKEEKPSSRPKPVKSPSSPASSASVKKTAVVSKTKPAASPRAKSQGSPSGTPAASLFGLFGGGKSEEKVEAAVKPKESAARASAAPAPAPAVPKAPAFNLFGTAPKAPAGKGKETPAAPPASSKTVGPSTKKSPPSGGGGGGGMFDFLGGVTKATTKSAPPAPALPPPPPQQQQQVAPKPSGGANPFAGLFGSAGGGSSSEKKAAAAAAEPKAKPKPKPKPKPKRQPLPAPPPAPAPMVSRVKTMDDAFLRKVSLMLKRNQTKIKKFQQLTDRFRGGLITAPVYYDGVEGLFGEENVEEIIGPLLAALPENDKRRALQQVYNKAQKARGVSSQQDAGGLTGGLAGLFGGWGAPKSESSPAPSDLKKKEEAVGARGTGKGGGAADDPYAFAAAKLKDADYQLFVARTKLFTKGGINARNYYDTLAKLFGKDGVPKQLPAVLKTLPQNKRKVLQDVYDGLNKRS